MTRPIAPTDPAPASSPAPTPAPIRLPRRPPRDGSELRPVPAAVQDLFGIEASPTSALPPPLPMLESLTRSVVEILAGARDLDQIARWVSDDVYRGLLKRTVLSARARQARGERVSRPAVSLGRTRISEPADGVIEAVTIVHGRGRSRAVAIRLEGLDRRWRATAITVL